MPTSQVMAAPFDFASAMSATPAALDSLATWTRAGGHVDLAVLTDGSKGTWDPASDTAALVATRQAEQRAAAHALGAHAVHFLGAIDGELEADAAMRRRWQHPIWFRRTLRKNHSPTHQKKTTQ